MRVADRLIIFPYELAHFLGSQLADYYTKYIQYRGFITMLVNSRIRYSRLIMVRREERSDMGKKSE